MWPHWLRQLRGQEDMLNLIYLENIVGKPPNYAYLDGVS